MTTGATGQLGLALPVQGELSGTWGDTVNNGITQYTNIAIAGTLALTGDGAVTLANTTGDASASNITSSLAGAGTVTAQFAIVRVSGTTTTKVVTGPSYSKTYVVDNASSYAVTFKASGQTGVSIAAAEKVTVVFNGTDYIKLAGTIANAAGSNTQIQFNNGGLFGASASLTWDGTTLSSTQINITGQGTLRLQDTTGGEYVAHRAPSALGASYTLTWPADDGTTGQALITDGSGTLSWSSAASGDVYGPASATANGIVLFDGTTGKLIKDSASTDGLIYGITVGRGAGAVSTNTAVGASALAANTSGDRLTAIGRNALTANTTGNYSVAVGNNSLATATTAQFNTAVGDYAMQATTGSSNTGIGAASLYSNSSGQYNTALGHASLQANTTASNNTAVGYQAGYSNTTGAGLALFGYNAGYANTASNNTGFGYNVLVANTSGTQNTAIGGGAIGAVPSVMQNNTTGSYNTAVGHSSLASNTTASNNTAVGFRAGYSNQTGQGNTFVGRDVGYNTTGGSNTFIGFNDNLGYGAGQLVTTGSKNTILGGYNGNQGGLDIRTASNYIVLSDGDGVPRGYFDNNGKFIIGAAASSADRLLINGPVSFGQAADTNAYVSFLGGTNYLSGSGTIRMTVSSGGVQLTSGATSWASVSDERLKDIIEPITDAMEKVGTLRTVMGKYKTDEEGTRRPFLIAQDVLAVLPEAVDSVADTRNGDETEYLSVRYTDTIPLLIAAIKELKAEIDQLKGQA